MYWGPFTKSGETRGQGGGDRPSIIMDWVFQQLSQPLFRTSLGLCTICKLFPVGRFCKLVVAVNVVQLEMKSPKVNPFLICKWSYKNVSQILVLQSNKFGVEYSRHVKRRKYRDEGVIFSSCSHEWNVPTTRTLYSNIYVSGILLQIVQHLLLIYNRNFYYEQ